MGKQGKPGKESASDPILKLPGSKVKIAVSDIDGVLRGKILQKKKFIQAVENGFGFCDVIFGWDANDKAYDNGNFTGWQTGYPDAEVRIDKSTYRKLPWENDIPFFLGDFVDKSGNGLSVCPRSLLKKIVARAVKEGFVPAFSQEFEWFNFKETPGEISAKRFRDLNPLTSGMFGYSELKSSQNSRYFHDLFDLLLQAGIPLEGLHTETGPGVYEAAIVHSSILEAADRAILFKTAVKEIAYRHGLMASFMAKWNADLPGCGGHIHQSLWDESKNLFWKSSAEGHMSQLMRSYLAGQIHCLPKILPMIAPTVNSYKRLVEGAWAPTTITWGHDNRTTAWRTIMRSAGSARLESRIPGSDVNPYLAMAACLASGLYGIAKGMKLNQDATTGTGYADHKHGLLPRTLHDAIESMKGSDIANELFGETFTDHFIRTREWEWRQYSNAVTDWELKRYFEII